MTLRIIPTLFAHFFRSALAAVTHTAPRPAPVDTGDAPERGDEAVVHATLTPEGLVSVNGVVEGAVWCGDGPAPPRGAPVSVSYDEARQRWQVLPVDSANRESRNGDDR